MATSPNYGWSEPDNTSLVRDGALAMRTLGDAIDTSLWNVGYGQAGKNKIINGDFNINQRAFTSTTVNGQYTFDRFTTVAIDGTSTYTAQTFTLGAAPVAGYEGKNFIDVASTGQTLTTAQTRLENRMENVRTFANQTVTVSFWAKAASGTPKVAVELAQFFGTGGSPSATVNTYAGSITLTTSFQRYSVSVAVPSISGKTLGTANNDSLRLNLFTSAGSDLNARTGSLGIQTATISFWGIQVEAGSVATAFQTATGTIQGELDACSRYYQRFNIANTYQQGHTGWAYGTSDAIVPVDLTVQMRVAPTALETNNLRAWIIKGVTYVSGATFTLLNSSPNQGNININKGAAFTVEDTISLNSENQSSVYYAFTAEL
jgi:hypothetical protein